MRKYGEKPKRQKKKTKKQLQRKENAERQSLKDISKLLSDADLRMKEFLDIQMDQVFRSSVNSNVSDISMISALSISDNDHDGDGTDEGR